MLKHTNVAFFLVYCLSACEVSSCADSSIPPSLLPTSRLFLNVFTGSLDGTAHFPAGSELHASN